VIATAIAHIQAGADWARSLRPRRLRESRDDYLVSDWFSTYSFAEVHDDLIIGAFPLDADDIHLLATMGVTRVLNLVEDQEYPPGRRFVIEAGLREAGIEEHRMQLTDFGHLPADQLELAVRQVLAWLKDGALSYVHCRAGWQRSAAVAIGAVAVYDGVGIEEAISIVQRRKPSADPLPHQRDDLRAWWAQRSGLQPRR
jgi:protein-tyrosine phosphatase